LNLEEGIEQGHVFIEKKRKENQNQYTFLRGESGNLGGNLEGA
jgi:hypothetical protein